MTQAINISPYLQRNKRSEAHVRQERIDRIARNLVREMPFCTRDAVATGDKLSKQLVQIWFGYDWRTAQ